MSLFNDRLLLNPMLRIEMILNDLSGEDPSRSTFASVNNSNDFPVSGKLGARFEIIEFLEAMANFGRGYRIPSFLELFGDRGSTVGNSNLKPEKSWNFDLGLAWHPDRYRVAATYFEHRTKDLIQFLQSSQFTAQARNLASATIRGFEIDGRASIVDRQRTNTNLSVDIDFNYTFQWAKDTSGRAGFDGKFLPGRPRHQLHAGLQVSYHWARFFTDFDFIDENFLDSFNALKVSRRSLVGTGFTLSPWKWVQAGFEVKNLLNQRIEDVVGFPVPGRLFFGKVRFVI
jgi:iron complex outermembrane receptor protein